MCQCGENHFSSFLVQIHLISWMHFFSLKFKCFPFVIGDYFRVRHLCLQKCHVHSTLLSVECKQHSVLCSGCLLPELSVRAAGQRLIFLFDQIILLKNTQFRSYFAWLACCGVSVGFLGNNVVMICLLLVLRSD
jgi:hypothetical protein